MNFFVAICGDLAYSLTMKNKNNKVRENPLKAQIRDFTKTLEQYTKVNAETIKALEKYTGA